MVTIVVKKEGATQTCGNCGTELICRLKDYGGNFAPTLQWQNFNGTAHFKTTDGKNYNCNIPEDDETEQTRIPSEAPKTPASPPSSSNPNPPSFVDSAIRETIENIDLRLQSMEEMIQAIFRYTVDQQLGKT